MGNGKGKGEQVPLRYSWGCPGDTEKRKKTHGRWLAPFACAWASSLLGIVAPAFADTCAESCVINVVHERLYASHGVSNFYYNYAPTSQWASKDCIVTSFAIDEGRPSPLWYVPAYLVGWTKAYYDGKAWRTFGGDPGKYFLTQTTPFHAAADVILTGTLPGLFPGVVQALNTLYPRGCSDLPSQQPNQNPNPDSGRPECNNQIPMN